MPTQLDLPTLLNEIAARPRPELNDRALRTQLLMLMHQQTLSSLARVQFQQLHSLSHQQAQGEAPQATQSWNLEIPVRHGAEHNPLQLQIDQDWLERESEKEGETARKVRQWQLLLSFPLPEAGNFYAQLTLVEDQVAVRLWAEQPETVREAQNKLEQLKKQLEDRGIEVTRLECVAGKPPERKTSMQYSLVDVTT